VGGYSSGPVIALAALRGIPTLLMEQNAMPGVTNRLLANLVDAAAVTYDESRKFFGGKAFVAGNPVRPEFLAADPPADERTGGSVAVLVFGGSQGAHAINVAMMNAVSRLKDTEPRLSITHQTGERDLEAVRDAYRRAGVAARVEPYLFRMDEEMRAADLVVCRAGATTLAELTAAGRPSLLVPLPTATDDHQRRNASALVTRGAARMIEQRELDGERLARELVALAADAPARRGMAEAARAMARPDAARVVVDGILALAGSTRP
jgi:UDP-N-acetylglucosamine--N-acetylmuramyl-(pentapeptide) pyrophosphoryl-undecaprenol N-acetylglucosamine transferase